MDKWIIGIGMLALFVMVFPDAKTAWDSFITAALEATGVTTGIAYLLLTNVPYFAIAALIFRVVMALLRRKPGGSRFQ